MRTDDLTAAIVEAANRLGVRSGPRVVDDVLPKVFPKTVAAADVEGADRFLRNGLIAHADRLLKGSIRTDGQRDLADVDPSFGEYVKALRNKSYFVPERGEYVGIADLIASPSELKSAADSIRQHGKDCIAEANRLDRLHDVVVGATPQPSNDDHAAEKAA